MYKKLVRCLTLIFAVFLLGACGLLVGEPFIEAIPQWAILQEASNFASIDLRDYPDNNQDFTNFVIFYRIYVSEEAISPTTIENATVFLTINPTLNTNFNSIRPRIDNEDRIGENLHAVFTGLGFRYLVFRSADTGVERTVSQVLGNNFFQSRPPEWRVLEFDFTSGAIPTMTISPGAAQAGLPYETVYHLLRANTHLGSSFSPQPPERLFLNSDELRDRALMNINDNADVADRAGDLRYTYVAMFIAAVGMSQMTFANVYSTPSFIHVFLLPDDNF